MRLSMARFGSINTPPFKLNDVINLFVHGKSSQYSTLVFLPDQTDASEEYKMSLQD